MNVKRFVARTAREALTHVKQAFGDDAVVLSTRPCEEGVEVLAMAPEGMQHIERLSNTAPVVTAAPAASATPAAPAPAQPSLLRRAFSARAAASAPRLPEPAQAAQVQGDVEQLAMSTLSFQDYVRERMLKRREAALKAEAQGAMSEPMPEPQPEPVRAQPAPVVPRLAERMAEHSAPVRREAMPPAEPIHVPGPVPTLAEPAAARREQADRDMMDELRSMKGLIEERFGALAFMEKLQRHPAQARLTQKLLDCGFSPALIRKLAESLPADTADEMAWATNVLERNLLTGEAEAALEDQGGVYALIGATGVGKTTSTAKLAAAFAAKYGAANLGLITLDAYRVGAHEQLRTYGRILGVPVHTAHDRASLEDLLDLLSAKKMVLIDTAGMAQRDARTRELLDMLAHPSIRKLLVVNASAQGETIEDVLTAYRAAQCRGVILSKMDEAVKLGPALDPLIRHRLCIVGVANGQRVPEDWHRLSSQALMHRALRPTMGNAYRMDASDVNLIFAAPQAHARPAALHA